MPWSPEVLVAGPLIVLSAYVLFGISGFGSALVSIPLLAHFLPLTTVLPLMVMLDFSAAFTTAWRGRRAVDVPEARRVFPAMLAGILAGVLLLKSLPGTAMLAALGLFVAGYGMAGLLRGGRAFRLPSLAAHPTGLLGGLLGAVFGVGGPVYAMYFTGRIPDTTRRRATLSAVFTVSTGIRIAAFVAAGLLAETRLLFTAATLLPLMLAGTWIGRRIHGRMSAAQVGVLVHALLVGSGASLLARAAGLH
jgi:uncharacterized membrane protein YfcA